MKKEKIVVFPDHTHIQYLVKQTKMLDGPPVRLCTLNTFEPVHEISNNVVCATSKASDQPAHMRSLIRAFASRLSILLLLSL